MKQYQIAVENADHIVFATEWIMGAEAAMPVALLIASRFPEPYLVLVRERSTELQAIPWNDFVSGNTVTTGTFSPSINPH
jgi:hypothetical protein